MPISDAEAVQLALLENNPYKMVIDVFTITHSEWPETLHITRNYVPGGSVTADGVTYTYIPCGLERAGQDGNLQQTWKLVIQDLNKVIQDYESQVSLDSDELPVIELRGVLYDKLTGVGTVVEGPYTTDTSKIDYDYTGASINASAERVNVNGCGIRMTASRYGTLRPYMR